MRKTFIAILAIVSFVTVVAGIVLLFGPAVVNFYASIAYHIATAEDWSSSLFWIGAMCLAIGAPGLTVALVAIGVDADF